MQPPKTNEIKGVYLYVKEYQIILSKSECQNITYKIKRNQQFATSKLLEVFKAIQIDQ